LRSSVTLPRNVQWNTAAYFVNRLPALAVPSYTRLDTNLIWDAGEHFSLSAVGQNLVRNLHPEFSGVDDTVQPGLMRRDAYAKIAWSF
jgi:iron complex outermembrane receptor protein